MRDTMGYQVSFVYLIRAMYEDSHCNMINNGKMSKAAFVSDSIQILVILSWF